PAVRDDAGPDELEPGDEGRSPVVCGSSRRRGLRLRDGIPGADDAQTDGEIPDCRRQVARVIADRPAVEKARGLRHVLLPPRGSRRDPPAVPGAQGARLAGHGPHAPDLYGNEDLRTRVAAMERHRL